jgi:FkbM family methyltransferase
MFEQLLKKHFEGPAGRGTFQLENGKTIHQWQKFETEFLWKEIWEEETYGGKHGVQLKPGAVVYDCGANIGMFSLWVHDQCKGDVDIVAFEPIPSTWEVLNKNAKDMGPRVKALNCGVSDSPAEVDFEAHPFCTIWSTQDASFAEEREQRLVDDFTAAVVHGDGWLSKVMPAWVARKLVARFIAAASKRETVRCTLRRLGDVIREQGHTHIDLLKVDVEGAEVSILTSIDDDQWPGIQQVAMEVENFKLRDTCTRILESKGFSVTSVATEQENNKHARSEVCNVYAFRQEQAGADAGAASDDDEQQGAGSVQTRRRARRSGD